MVFSSIQFVVVFFPLFFLCYYGVMAIERLIAHGKTPTTFGRNAILLIFSLLFYAMGQPENLLLIGFSLLVNYLSALLIDLFAQKQKKLSTLVMVLDTIVNLGLLGYYKYTGFLLTTIRNLSGANIKIPEITLPIGISFFTFQILSYVIDVYRGKLKAQKNIGIVAVYLAAFPQLIAGPIVRYSDIELQLTNRTETMEGVSAGLCRFIVGLSKKVIIANTVSTVADGLLSHKASEFGLLGAWLAATAYTLQIYYDFSGYSDMAIGMGKMMGFTYLENFNYPYCAKSVNDFWRRWHMSLSQFFRDYVYIPLGGNRVSVPRWMLNMGIVWMLTGLWHGAAWTFILWGVYYGILLIAEKKLFPHFAEKLPILSRIYTILVFVVGWVIFRAPDLPALGQTLFAMVGGYGLAGTEGIGLANLLRRADFGGVFLIVFVIGVILSNAPRPKSLRGRFLRACEILPAETDEKPSMVAVTLSRCICTVMLVLCLILLQTGAYNPFLYFQF